MRISVFGCGYVGLTVACCLAKVGHQVWAIDKDAKRLEHLNKGKVPFFEPGLEELLQGMKKSGWLQFSGNAEDAIRFADVVICAVGTPTQKNGEVNLEGVLEVAKAFGKFGGELIGTSSSLIKKSATVTNEALKKIATAGQIGKIFINKSTLPIGAHRQIDETIQASQSQKFRYAFFYNPEFLSEGTAIENFLKPYRIVVGVVRSDACAQKLIEELYQPILQQKNFLLPRKNSAHKNSLHEVPLLFTNPLTAEMIKYASNAFLATKVSFINEMAHFCEKFGADISEVAKGIGLDPRIGSQFLKAGLGFGGSCLPKDIEVLLESGRQKGLDGKLLKAVEEVNKIQPFRLVEKVKSKLGSLKGKKIAVCGLSFKANTDDIRCSPALKVVDLLLKHKAQLTVYDPVALEAVKKLYGTRLTYAQNMNTAVKHAEALLILVAWENFKKTDIPKMKSLHRQGLIFKM